MMLYLVRHGIAEEAGAGVSDAHRALTAEGRKKMRGNARGLLEVVGAKGVSGILTSPLVRARQTAEILLEALEKHGETVAVEVSGVLAGDGALAVLLKRVREMGGAGVIAVGHEPLLSGWVGELCFDTGGRVEMKKGALAAIELEEAGARGVLAWLMQPGMLRGK